MSHALRQTQAMQLQQSSIDIAVLACLPRHYNKFHSEHYRQEKNRIMQIKGEKEQIIQHRAAGLFHKCQLLTLNTKREIGIN